MSVTPIDLSGLEALNASVSGKDAGKPLSLELDRVHEDPNQPRKTFDDVLELAASIAEVGVKVPITVVPHPSIADHYMVKFGARRRRAAVAAGLTQIPAWLEEAPNDFEQVIENLQRSDLTAMELALFMADKIGAGMKQTEVAKKLGIRPSAVTKHLALVNAPAEIEAVYRSGRNTSPETIFELRSVFQRFPDETRAWLAQDVDISRRSVEQLKQALAGVVTTGAEPSEGKRRGRKPRKLDASEIKRPVVAVTVAGRFGIIVLSRRAKAEDHLLVKWDDTAEVVSVPCRDVRVLRLDDARRYEPINRGLDRTDA
jgi:ParB family transcriptional regulator, chromosome partitioning protein